MSDLNFVGIAGRLTKDVELKKTGAGTSVCEITLANNGRPKPDGTKPTYFFSVVCWGKNADNCAKYLAKGSKIIAKGHLVQNNWTDDKGIKHTREKIEAEEIYFVETKKSTDQKEQQETVGDFYQQEPNF